jgi:7-cyano-7-deazaguanine reductase
MTLTKLGSKDAQVDGVLEWFPIDELAAHLNVTLECTEFTCRCPVTHQPDWATIVIKYEPHLRVIESKSLKMYLETFRNVGIFHEQLAQNMLDDLVKVLEPWECAVTVHFNTRGGIAISATATYDPKEEK